MSKTYNPALVRVAEMVEHRPMHIKIASSIPDQVVGSIPGRGLTEGRTMFLSLLSLSPLSL